MTGTSLTDLAPDVRAILDRYFTDVDAAMRPIDPEVAEATVEDLRQHALETLTPQATITDVEALVAELGEPESFANGLRGADGAPCAGLEQPVDDSAPQGRFLGMPYDLRVPTTRRVTARWWSPADTRIIVPRVFGMGWTVNFGAVAVQLGLIEPDAEDVPFASVPESACFAMLLVPVGLTAAIAGSYLALRSRLPEALPSHWGVSGTVDAYSSQLSMFAWLLAMAAVPTVAALWAVASRRPGPTRAVLIGGATFLSALAAGVWTLSLTSAFGAQSAWLLPLALLVALPLGATFAVFVTLARAGRAAEQERDLARGRTGTR